MSAPARRSMTPRVSFGHSALATPRTVARRPCVCKVAIRAGGDGVKCGADWINVIWRHRLYFSLGLVSAAALTCAVVVYVIITSRDRAQAAGFAATVVGLVSSGVALLRWAWNTRRAGAGPAMAERTLVLDELAAALLVQWRDEAHARGLVLPAPVGVRWTWTRRPVATSVAEAVAPVVTGAGPGEVPGAKTTQASDFLTDGVIDRLYEIYAGIGVGRLVVLGGAGTGKTAAAILLVLEALSSRAALLPEQRVQAPVPVLLTLAGWEPKSAALVEWAADRLLRDYPLLRRRGHGRALAVSLIRDGRIALVLDGLDEMAVSQRAPALRGMSAALATRIVLLTRPHEYEHASRADHLPGAVVELLPVDTTTASEYLLRGRTTVDRRTWEQLTAQLQASASCPLARALSTPLMLTLARASYPAGENPAELADRDRFPTAEAIENHLVDRMILNAYGLGEDRQSKYEPAQAVRWLGYIASNMHREGSRDLAWWRISRWTPPWSLAVGLGLVFGLLALALAPLATAPFSAYAGLLERAWLACTTGFTLGLVFGLGGIGRCAMSSSHQGKARPAHGKAVLATRDLINLLLLCLIPAILYGVPAGNAKYIIDYALMYMFVLAPCVSMLTLAGIISGMPIRIVLAWPGRTDWAVGASIGMFGGLLAALIDTWFTDNMPVVAIVGNDDALKLILSGVAAGIVLGCCAGFVRAGYRKMSTSTPIMLWRSDVGASFLIGILFCLTSFVVLGFYWRVGVFLLVPTLLAIWLVSAFAAGRASQLLVASVIGRMRGKAPVRLLRFLQDARGRQVLRQAGAVYQFRHARIQDRLAAMYDAEENGVAWRRWKPSLVARASDRHVGPSPTRAPSVRRLT